MIKDNNPLKQQTQQFVQELKAGSNAILVAIRVRPLNSKQLSISQFETIRVLDDKVLALMDPGTQFLSTDVLRKNRNKQTQYAFDYVFDKNVSNKQVYDQSVTFLLDGLMQGYHATIMAYGPTGCGKTHTMIGNNQQPGILPLSMMDLLSRINQQKKKWKDVLAKVSYLQIYNENLKDLLISEDKNFELRQDPKQGIVIPGITQVTISSLNQLITVLKVGNRNRSKQSTKANEASSRSHGILQVTVEIRERAQTTVQQTFVSKLSLVDLAGSQRAANTTNKGLRMVQGAKINQSLLMLGNCIQALSQANQKGLKKVFIPYRGSKLTRLLKDSLGGNCRTILIVCVSSFIQTFQDTYNTLIYANRAKNIKNNAIRNVLNVETHLSNYVQIITTLKKQNQQLKQQLATSPNKQIQTQKNSSFPVLPKNSAYHSEMEKYEIWIESHFKQERQIVDKIYDSQQRIQKAAFAIFKHELTKNQNQIKRQQSKTEKLTIKNNKKIKEQESEQSAYRVNQIVIQQLSLKKQELKLQLENKHDSRSYLVNEIKRNDIIGQAGQPYLMALYKERKAQLQSYIIQLKQKLYQYEKKQKDILLRQMKNQLKIRQKIIEEQKVLIQKNNIIQRITYTKLNKIESINLKNQSLDLKKKQDNDLFDNASPPKFNKIKILPKKTNKHLDYLAPDDTIDYKIDFDYTKQNLIKKKSKFKRRADIQYPEKKYYFNLKDKQQRRQQYSSSQNIRNNKKIGLSNRKQQQRQQDSVDKNSSKKQRIDKIKSNKVFDVVMMHR